MSRAADRRKAPVVFRRVELDAPTDDPIVRSMLRHGTALEPDPAFERRLRGIVLNRHVAAREGYRVPPVRGRMTPIGRGVLLGSVLVAASVTGVGAYAQSALPEDPLYPIKLQIEGLRLAVAPADMRDDLLALALEERARELAQVAEARRWAAAEEAAWRVATAEAALVAVDGLTPGVAARLQAHLAALDRVLAHAPASAAAIVAERLDPARASLTGHRAGRQGGTEAPGGFGGSEPGHAGGPPSHGGGTPRPRATGQDNAPDPSERPSRTPRPSPGAAASGAPNAD